MVYAVYFPVLFSALFGAGVPGTARRLPPRLAIWVTTVGATVCSAALVITAALLGFTLLAQTPFIAEHGGWDAESVEDVSPVAAPIALVALAVLALASVQVLRVVRRRAGALRDSFALAAALASPAGELAVIDDPGLQAWAIPGHPGRIVISTALLRTLDTDERRAVIAHERAHLSAHHHLHHAAAQVTAAANPLLWRVPRAVELAAERSADESAAKTCSRRVVANALLHASVAPQRHPPRPRLLPLGILEVASSDVVIRVRALRAPTPRLALGRLALVLMLLALTVAAVVEAVRDTRLLFVAARAWKLTEQGTRSVAHG